ncbi:sugar phosphate nucleotidyltransferase [Salinibacter sp.]|uniref:sugar phosphate nucleotidyltransferase n=1 Tax=Salinibacter sp. TaxID=2065818 RepID=UPI0021E87A53|nr:sugar phosphate nucleotidyltransferase [Salinibacter sp.]
MKSKEFSHLCIHEKESALSAMQKMDKAGHKLLIVESKEGEFSGLLSIGDIQRHLVNGGELNVAVSELQRNDIRVCREKDGYEKIRAEMLHHRTEYMPILTSEGELSEVMMWEDIFKSDDERRESIENVTGVIMAGGKGTRLRPLTNVIPKPLVPVDDRPILEHIIDWFSEYGVTDLFISVGYKSDMIRQYVADNVALGINITFIEEDQPLGSIGSLALMREHLKETIVVSNCDILIDNSLADIVDSHEEKGNAMTLVSSIKSYDIPYGVVNVDNDGEFVGMDEKPTKNFWVNTGVYVIGEEIYSLVEEREMNMDELIDQARESDYRVGAFPVSEGAWMDVGQWDEYNRTKAKMRNKSEK